MKPRTLDRAALEKKLGTKAPQASTDAPRSWPDPALIRPKRGEPDPLLVAAGDSPALERYRMAKAQIAELELQERRGQLVNMEIISQAIRPAALAMRGTGQLLTRRFGNEAAELFNEGVKEAEQAALAIVARFTKKPAGSTGPTAEASAGE